MTGQPHELPHPHGPLSGRRRRWRRKVGYMLGKASAVLFHTPPGRMAHRRLHAGLEFTSHEVRLTRGHAELDGLRVAFLSDLHAGNFMTADDLARIARSVADWNPALVLFGGDLINTRFEEVTWFRDALGHLRPQLGVWAVPGNHEYYDFEIPPVWRAWLEAQGVGVLWNRGVRVGVGAGSLWLAGVDDLTEGAPDLNAALDGRGDGEPTLLMSHHPDVFVEAARLGCDLQLSGHTHGGQIKVLGRTPVVHTDHGFLEGLHRLDASQLLVGRGVGVTVAPVRIGAPAEVLLITLRVG